MLYGYNYIDGSHVCVTYRLQHTALQHTAHRQWEEPVKKYKQYIHACSLTFCRDILFLLGA